MARTTLNLDPSVLRGLRERGVREGKTLGELASELLAAALAAQPTNESQPSGWATWDLGAPRVDLEDKEAVRRALEAPS